MTTTPDEHEARESVRARLAEAARADYEITGELGRGGMGWVFLGRDRRLGRLAALKVLPPFDALRPASVERFRREAETAARLSHAHIVPIYGAGGDLATPYFAMAYVEGETLATRLAREGALPLAEGLRIAREVGSALAYAHRQGVVHRDIKPQNVLLERDSGRALVADFGIARATTGERMTMTGAALGTPGYMAPEQAAGSGDVDARTDQYALGVLCFEMMTGKRFESVDGGAWPTSATAVRRAVRHARPDLPGAVADAIARATAVRRDDRWSDVDALLAALGAVASGSGVVPRVSSRTWWYGGAVVALVLAAAALVLRGRLGARLGPEAVSAGAPKIALMTFDGDSAAVDSLGRALQFELEGFSSVPVADRRSFAPPRGAGPLAPEVHEAARRAGASWILYGLVAARGGAREVQVRAIEVATGRVTELGHAPAPAMDGVTVDSIVLLLVHSRVGEELGFTTAGAATPASPEAIRAYSAAEEAFRKADYQTAVREYDRVARLDTSFALAEYKRFLAALQSEPTEDTLRAAVAAMRRIVTRAGLREGERRLLGAYLVLFDGHDVARAESQLRQLIAEDSTFLDGWFALGEVRYHFGALAGLPPDSAVAAFNHALALWPNAAPALMHLIALELWLGRDQAADTNIARYLAIDSLSTVGHAIALGKTVLRGSIREQEAVLRRLGSLEERVLVFSAIAGATIARDRRDLINARLAFEELARPGRSMPMRRIGANFALATLLAEGRYSDFARDLERYRSELPGDADLPRWRTPAAGLGFGGGARPEVADIGALRAIDPMAAPFHPFATAWPERYELAKLQLARGDTAGALRFFEAQDFVASVGDIVVRGPVWLARGRILLARKDRSGAERYFRRAADLLRYAEPPWDTLFVAARTELRGLGVTIR